MQLAKVAAQLDFLKSRDLRLSRNMGEYDQPCVAALSQSEGPAYGQGFDTEDTLQAYLTAGVPSKETGAGHSILWSRLELEFLRPIMACIKVQQGRRRLRPATRSLPMV